MLKKMVKKKIRQVLDPKEYFGILCYSILIIYIIQIALDRYYITGSLMRGIFQSFQSTCLFLIIRSLFKLYFYTRIVLSENIAYQKFKKKLNEKLSRFWSFIFQSLKTVLKNIWHLLKGGKNGKKTCF